MTDPLIALLSNASSFSPTRIDRELATELVGTEEIKWLVDHDVLSILSPTEYGLVDEFLRVRLLMDQTASKDEVRVEKEIIYSTSVEEYYLAHNGESKVEGPGDTYLNDDEIDTDYHDEENE